MSSDRSALYAGSVLVVEDDRELLELLLRGLREEGLRAVGASTGHEAIERSNGADFDVMVIDIGLPDADGRDVCQAIRAKGVNAPVLFLTARDAVSDRLSGFAAGADDYITKPFRPRELVARLLAHLRRAEPGDEQPPVELDGLQIDLAARVVRRDGDDVHLTPIEFSLLGVLTQNRGRLLTHNALLQQVWGPAHVDARQTLRAHIANLRRKVEPTDGERLIQTDHGVGYRLADVHPRPEAFRSATASASRRA
jgi:two-component system KDP operon response regulator KdpE